jgi:glutaredoxin
MKLIKQALVIGVFLVLGLFGGKLLGPAIATWTAPSPIQAGDYRAYTDASGKSLVLFSTSTCPHCKATRDYFASHGMDYQDYVIDKSPEAMKRFLTLHEKGVPIILTATRKIRGFNAALLDKEIAPGMKQSPLVPTLANK